MGTAIKYLNLGIKYILILLMTVLVVAVFMQVVFRFVIEQPLAWTEELGRYCLIWITFLGAGYAMATNSHIGVEFFVEKAAVPVRRVTYILSATACLVFFLLLVLEGYELAVSGMSQSSPVLQIPMGYIYAAIPVSGVILIINLAFQFMKNFKSGGV
ncbi:TRAP transporter small permease [Indiicoccus explosivorum]|uniref:TRAP transporter small permease n=1 Tax=Indiicoccus explosivorum TaxID=1917864 RepID=UPI000B43D5FE|nr:TRAP transporter small permease [Indiicoccus explosivorum]